MKIKENFEDYSSGRVLYGAPKATNFSVRLADEIFIKCKDYLVSKGNKGPYIMYDPFCGAGYAVTVLGIMHGQDIKKIFASDIDNTILEFAKKNLALLTPKGVLNRTKELERFVEEYKKDSHKEAVKSAERLAGKINKLALKIEVFEFNILSEENLDKNIKKIDIIIADVPYGKLTTWVGSKPTENPVQGFLNKIKDKLSEKAIIAVVSNKKQVIQNEGFTKLKSFKTPNRKITLLIN
jgi:tRNA G10  N-methylase Trm11